MKRFLIFFSLILLVIFIFAIAFFFPNSLPAHSDFSALYNTDLALVHRVPIYDIPTVEALAQQHSGLPPENFFLARFPYPPWYALSTFYLGLLPANVAATLWFELNLIMLFISLWLLTDGWPGRLRLVAFPLGLFFLPVLGALSVGQYDFPILLGTSLLVYSIRKENVALTTLGIILLTFKPHIGALILLAVWVWLIVHKSSFGQRVIRSVVIAAGILFIAGFLADPSWIISYPRMLLNYQEESNVAACSECASLPVWLSRWLLDGSLLNAAWIAVTLLIFLGILFSFVRSSLKWHPALLSASVLVTLLVSPYLYNYDFLLLLIPFLFLVPKSNPLQKIVVLICYLVPTFALIFYGRNGNISLIFVTLVLTILLYLHMVHTLRVKNSVIDFTAPGA
jgi:hypothetical protein